ncbi:uncharacterized protein LOC124343815 [Daphnia pulicaria]|uniref:uncharacterized protein LOC124343815 n=1 Tax=Daphnia pulicaria TaxID=35523 RepID=UPI001EEBFBC6|nr:uncharacterized protein LOC124343815 [Daphnia pulicaria]
MGVVLLLGVVPLMVGYCSPGEISVPFIKQQRRNQSSDHLRHGNNCFLCRVKTIRNHRLQSTTPPRRRRTAQLHFMVVKKREKRRKNEWSSPTWQQQLQCTTFHQLHISSYHQFAFMENGAHCCSVSYC